MVLALFDIDGTILSTNGAGRAAVNRAVSAVLGRTFDTADVTFSGRTDRAIMHDVLIAAGWMRPDPAEVERCLTAYSDALIESLAPDDVTLYPGVEALIRRLAARDDVQMGLVTGNLQSTAYRKLEIVGLHSFFPIGAFGSDHEDRNELPAIASQRARQYFGRAVEPDRTVVIGDTTHDITCSRHFGARAVAVCTGRISREMLEADRPDLLLDTLDPGDEVDRLIDELLAL